MRACAHCFGRFRLVLSASEIGSDVKNVLFLGVIAGVAVCLHL
jgi:hypothetical protein